MARSLRGGAYAVNRWAMKLVSFRRAGQTGWGSLSEGGIADLSRHYPTLKAAFAAGPEALAGLRAEAEAIPLAEVELLPPVPDSGWIVCVGLNYRSHIAEMRHSVSPDHPTLFTRKLSSLVGAGAALVRPAASEQFDYEGELAVVIGRGGRHIPEERAMEHVAGYSCFNDGSIRAWQRHTSQFTAGKNFDRSGAMGPWLVTAHSVPDWRALTLTTRLNGETVQDGRLSDLIFPLPRLIAYISTVTELQPGDVIATGTPEGVGAGRTPPLWMKAGDRVEVEIPGIGTLSNPVIDEG